MAKEAAVVAKEKYDFTKLNTLSVVSLASALTGIGAAAAIVTGHISLSQIKRSGENGRPLALIGLVLGYLSIALWILGGIAMVAIRFWLTTRGYDLGDYPGGMMNGNRIFDHNDMGPGMMWGNNTSGSATTN